MILIGDCRDKMRELIADKVKVQVCVTSPPYFGLRSYGIGAEKGEIGLEETLNAYVENMVNVFRLVRELLADDGTCWINLGDSYNGCGDYINTGKGNRNTTKVPGLKPKDLIGVPWRIAFALQADGWYLRSDIIWHKPNAMPESVKDRPTNSHEYIFLLAKNRKYYYDAEAIKEPTITRDRDNSKLNNTPGRNKMMGLKTNNYERRNKRSVWTLNTTPYRGSHFAVFPPELIEPCILAGSRVGDTVLDIFFGSGTTGEVAQKFGRKFIGIDINPNYEKLQKERTEALGLAFNL